MSTYNELDSISQELDLRILTVNRMGLQVDSLLSVKRELEVDKKLLFEREKINLTSIARLQNKVEGYTILLLEKDQQIARLKAANEKLYSQNTDLKTLANELNKNLASVHKQNRELSDKVDIASRLTLRGIRVSAIDSRGRIRAETFKNKHLNRLKIEVTLEENEIAPIRGGDLLLRVVDSDLKEIFDVNRGSGSFFFQGRERFYTVKQEYFYDRQSQSLTLYFEKESPYLSGEYVVEAYTEDYLVGSGFFTVL